MRYVIQFHDNPDMADMRQKYMADHLNFLEQNADAILAAGPLNDAQTSEPAGGLWIVEASQTADVQSLIETDPFWPTGLRQSVKILVWNRVFAAGKRMTG